MLTFPLWTPFLLPPVTAEYCQFCCTWYSVAHERLLSKRFREAWNEHFHVILMVRYDCLKLLGALVPSDDGSCRVLDDSSYIPWMHRDTHHLVRMPWHACKLVMATWPLRSGFPVTSADGKSIRWQPHKEVSFLDACSNAERTPALEGCDIREEINTMKVYRDVV